MLNRVHANVCFLKISKQNSNTFFTLLNFILYLENYFIIVCHKQYCIIAWLMYWQWNSCWSISTFTIGLLTEFAHGVWRRNDTFQIWGFMACFYIFKCLRKHILWKYQIMVYRYYRNKTKSFHDVKTNLKTPQCHCKYDDEP